MWFNAHNDIILGIKVPHPLLLNVKLNAIFLKLDISNTFYDNRKVSKDAKIRNRYNQVPHLTQDTNEKVRSSQLDTTNENRKLDTTNENRKF